MDESSTRVVVGVKRRIKDAFPELLTMCTCTRHVKFGEEALQHAIQVTEDNQNLLHILDCLQKDKTLLQDQLSDANRSRDTQNWLNKVLNNENQALKNETNDLKAKLASLKASVREMQLIT